MRPPRDVAALVDACDGFLIDLDGVVYVGDAPLPGAARAIAELRKRGKGILFLTNDPASSRSTYRSKLEHMGIQVTEDAILTAAFATAAYVAERHGRASAFVSGSRALKDEFRSAGLTVSDAGAPDVDVVVVGGHEGFDYSELRTASRFVRAGAALYATGRDPTYPMPDGPWPATGAILAAVETASGARAEVIGKPEPHMFEAARELLPHCRRLAVVGDRLETDVEGGRRAGLTTVLVAPGPVPEGAADLVVPGLGSLV